MNKEYNLYTVLAVWILLSIYMINVEWFVLTVIAITISEATLLLFDYIKAWYKQFFDLKQFEEESKSNDVETGL